MNALVELLGWQIPLLACRCMVLIISSSLMPELIRIDWRCVLSYSSFAVMRKLPFTATTVCIESWLLNCIGSCGAKSLAILRAILHTSVPLGLQTDRSFSMVSAEAHNMAATVRLLLTSSESKAYFFSKEEAASFVIESAIFLLSETALSILDFPFCFELSAPSDFA